MKKLNKNNELLGLHNVGKAVLRDLEILKITSVKQLATQDPDEMYIKLQKVTGVKHDPCVWDVFLSIVHEAKTGEKTKWWEWTKIRKNKAKKTNP